MIIRKVILDNKVSDEYIYIANSVFSLKDALETYPKYEKTILKTINSEKKELGVHINSTKFPKRKDMIERIELESDKILKAIGTKKQKFTHINEKTSEQKTKDAINIFSYLSKNLFYDTVSHNEIKTPHYYYRNFNLQHVGRELAREIKKYERLALLEKNREEKTKVKETLSELIYKKHKLDKLIERNLLNGQNLEILKALYNTLVNKKGVCGEFSYLYSYMLKKIGINSHVATILSPNDPSGHAINLVEIDDKYLMCDLTQSVGEYEDLGDEFNLTYFAMDKHSFDIEPDEDIVELERFRLISDYPSKSPIEYVEFIENGQDLHKEKNKIMFTPNKTEKIKNAILSKFRPSIKQEK